MNTESKPAIVFSGGLPYEDTDDHNTVTVLQGNEHVALDFTSEVVDYVTMTGIIIIMVYAQPVCVGYSQSVLYMC